jgi:tellurite resistance protein TerC
VNDLRAWIIFHALIFVFLAIDLGVGRKRAVEFTARRAAIFSAVWIGLGLSFATLVWVTRGSHDGLSFLTAYLVEEALSVDNLFVFAILFARLGVPFDQQHRLLFYGILGVLVLRGTMIVVGVALVERFHRVIPVFGGLLLIAAWRMMHGSVRQIDPGKRKLVRWFGERFPTANRYHGGRFFVDGQPTRLFVALLLIETTDLVFAFDSVPAVFAITSDRFIVYTSNVLAILGLRSLFFVLSHSMRRFHLLEPGLVILLSFIGIKMLASPFVHIPLLVSLVVIVSILMIAIVGSLLTVAREQKQTEGEFEMPASELPVEPPPAPPGPDRAIVPLVALLAASWVVS